MPMDEVSIFFQTMTEYYAIASRKLSVPGKAGWHHLNPEPVVLMGLGVRGVSLGELGELGGPVGFRWWSNEMPELCLGSAGQAWGRRLVRTGAGQGQAART